MKQILIILGLFASITTFAQSPRIKLNQITKDTVKGSVLVSSPSDSGMVYSRDFYIAYGADTVLILYGDTLAATSGIISSVLSDGVTITGNGTSGNELKVDTSLIVTIKALNDSLATISASTTPDGVTITGDGSVGNPLKVDTLLISTIQGLVDTLTNRGYLTANETITLSGDVTGSGTTSITATVVDDSHDHIISNVDFLQDSLNAKANDSDLANYVTLSGTDTITGAKTFTNTFTQSGGDADFDSGTLYVDESANRVGIGTSSPQAPLSVAGSIHMLDVDQTSALDNTWYIYNDTDADSAAGPTNAEFFMTVSRPGSTGTPDGPLFGMRGNDWSRGTDQKGRMFFHAGDGMPKAGTNGTVQFYGTHGIDFRTGGFSQSMFIEDDGGIIIPNLLNASTGNTMYYNTTSDEISYSSSSIRFKNDIEDLPIGLNELMMLKPTRYTYIPDGKKDYGFIAEQVYDVGLTEFVTFNQDNQIEGLKDKYFMILNTKAIQEQQAIIETQATEIEQLKTLITDLTNRLIILENK